MNKAKKTADNTAGAQQTNLTFKELQFIQMFFASDFCDDGVDSIIWDYSANDFLPYEGRIRSGVISSLEQKNVIIVTKKDKGDIAGTYSFSEFGKQLLAERNIAPDNVDEWLVDVENQPKPIELSKDEVKVLDFLMDTISYWKIEEPTYSNVGLSDITKEFNISKKAAREIVESLQTKGLVEKDTEVDIIYVIWDNTDKLPKRVSKVDSKLTQAPSSNAGKFKPYQQFGNHGVNGELEGYEKGDLVSFIIKGKKHKGIYIHFHKNNHSPNGYIVIKYNNKIYERVASKVSKIQSK